MSRETIKYFWMPKHRPLMDMTIYIATASAIIAVIIVLFKIYRTLCKYIDCYKKSPVMIGLGDEEGLIEFSLEELKQATNNFGDNNLIGQGRFGPFHIGMVRNTIVVIKRLSGSPRYLAEVIIDLPKIQHGNVVKLFGYCFENGHQMLMIYEYLFNGSMRDYLHDSIDLKFKKRIYIALGAAKGLQHLHSLNPPLTHNSFKTTKVLLDSNLNAKVSDAGLSRLVDVDHDLEVGLEQHQERFNETGKDVYDFGLFLLELMTCEEPKGLTSTEEVLEWIDSRIDSDTFLDERMKETFTREEFESVIKILLKCLRFPATRRPKMDEVVMELEKILTVEEDSNLFTLGSELFTIIA